MSLFDVLKMHNDTSCILLYGKTTDSIISSDLCIREFRVALADVLHEAGYDNVVFYDSTNATGKFVFDDASAVYTGISSKTNTSDESQKAQKNAPSVVQFGKPRKKINSAKNQNPSSIVADATVSQTPMQYQQRNMVEEVFHAELETYMKNDSYRSAVILTDINKFLRNSAVRDKFSEDIRHNWNKKNLLIFIHPDMNTPCNREFYRMLSEVSLMSEFYDKIQGEDNYTPKSNRVFKIYSFLEDEVKYLLILAKLQYGFKYPGGIEKVAEKINYILKNQKEFENIQFLAFSEMLQKYAEDTVTPVLDDAAIGEILNCDMKFIDFNPWETLKSRRGWEAAVRELESHLLNDNHESDVVVSSSRKTLYVKRLGGRDNQVEAYPGANKLPHIMIEGSPGTGKTTSIEQIGRIMHDAGLLAVGNVVPASRADLIGDVIGATSIKVREMVAKAEGGILFIDEAHQLAENNDKSDNGGIFAKEAVGQLVKCMTEPDINVLFVFAGYRATKGFKDGVKNLFDVDKGLEDRVKIKITIPDYTPDILTDIFYSALNNKGYILEPSISRKDIETFMTNVYQTRNRRTFSNGRYVTEVLIENCLIKHARKRDDYSTIIRDDFGDTQSRFEPVTLDKIEEEFSSKPGLGEIGISISKKYINYRQMKIDDGVEIDKIPNCKHMIFVGNPGTGKTTLVNMLCRAFGSANIMSGLDPVVVDTPIGLSLDELKEKIKDALNSNTILFIDEAHDSPDELMKALLHSMSENKDLTCAFAVYPNRLKDFLHKARGFRDRCSKPYIIPDYSPDQMYEIFSKECSDEENNCICSDEMAEQLKVLFRNWYNTKESDEDYSNARQVISLFEDIKQNYYLRVGSETYKEESVHTLLPVDIPKEHLGVIETQAGNRSFDEIMLEMDKYCGWEDLKNWLKGKYNLLCANRFSKVNIPVSLGHVCFVGSPGTGKSTSGALFAEACYSMGLLKTSKFTKYLAKDLVAGYKGQTAIQIAEALEAGRNGVIMIDEAYALIPDTHFGGSDFETAAINYLLDFLECRREDTVVILAGYENKIRELLSVNQGLKDRFSRFIRFPNFTPDECVGILNNMIGKYVNVDESCSAIAFEYFSKICIRSDFANARTVRNIQDEIFNAISERIAQYDAGATLRGEPQDGYDDVLDLSVIPEDIKAGFETWNRSVLSDC